MYYIYVDEAGTSRHEPVTVVVGVVIDADKHWKAAQSSIEQTYDAFVPHALRSGFIFHAKQVFAGYRDYDATWPRAQRLVFIAAMAAIPRHLRAAICLGRVKRTAECPKEATDLAPLEVCHHIQAFHGCISRADKYVRDWAPANEVAAVVAEDVPEKRRFLKETIRAPNAELNLSDEHLLLTPEEIRTGMVMQTNVGQISRIVDTINFTKKADAPLLPIADACAFSFRRFFSGKEHGEELLWGMLGGGLNWDEWQGPASTATFNFDPDKPYPSRQPPVHALLVRDLGRVDGFNEHQPACKTDDG